MVLCDGICSLISKLHGDDDNDETEQFITTTTESVTVLSLVAD